MLGAALSEAERVGVDEALLLQARAQLDELSSPSPSTLSTAVEWLWTRGAPVYGALRHRLPELWLSFHFISFFSAGGAPAHGVHEKPTAAYNASTCSEVVQEVELSNVVQTVETMQEALVENQEVESANCISQTAADGDGDDSSGSMCREPIEWAEQEDRSRSPEVMSTDQLSSAYHVSSGQASSVDDVADAMFEGGNGEDSRLGVQGESLQARKQIEGIAGGTEQTELLGTENEELDVVILTVEGSDQQPDAK